MAVVVFPTKVGGKWECPEGYRVAYDAWDVAHQYPYCLSIIPVTPVIGQGLITNKYINKAPEGNRIPLPTTVIADNNTFEVGTTAVNISSSSYIAGIQVKVYDPDNIQRAAPITDWTGISPSEELRWEYNIQRVDKIGDWTIDITFLKKDGTILDKVQTTMTANGAVGDGTPLTAQGLIVSKYINKAPEGSKILLPAVVKADSNTFEIGIIANNISLTSFIGGIEVKVYDPEGKLRGNPVVDYTGLSPNEELVWEYNICRVNKAGTWRIEIKFLEKTMLRVLDEANTTMVAVGVAEDEEIITPVPPEGDEIIPEIPATLEGWLPWILLGVGVVLILGMGKKEPERKATK